MYNNGDFIQVTVKYARSQVLPYSLGFISHIEPTAYVLTHRYRIIFYRLGKTGQSRLTDAMVEVPLVEDEYIREHCDNEFDYITIKDLTKSKSHSIKKRKVDLLRCPPEAFIAYLTAKITGLYNAYNMFEAHYNRRESIFNNNVEYTIEEFASHIENKDNKSLVSFIGYDKITPFYTGLIIQVMNDNGLSNLKHALLKRYEKVSFRTKELLDLNKLLARHAGVLEWRLSQVVRKIKRLRLEIRRGVYKVPHKDFVSGVLTSVLPKWYPH